MNLESCLTLHAWKNEHNKYLICVIQIAKRAIKYFSGQKEPHFTHHWLQPEHWVEFESKLNELGANGSFKFLSKKSRYKLSDSIQLTISRSTISIASLCDTLMPDIRKRDVIAAIDCKFEYLVQEEAEELSPFKDLHKVEKKANEYKIPRISEANRNIEIEKSYVTLRKNDRGKDDTDKNVPRKKSNEINEENAISFAGNLQNEQDPIDYLSTPRKETEHDASADNLQNEQDPIDYLSTPRKETELNASAEILQNEQYPIDYLSTPRKETELNASAENLQNEQDPIDYLSTPRKETEHNASAENLQNEQDPIDYLGTSLKDIPSDMLTLPSDEKKSQEFVTPQKLCPRSSSDGSHKKQATERKKQDELLIALPSKSLQKKSSNTQKACPKRYKRNENGSTSREREVSKKRKKFKKTYPTSSESSEDSHEENNS